MTGWLTDWLVVGPNSEVNLPHLRTQSRVGSVFF